MLSDEVIEKVIERVVVRIEETNTYVLKKMGESVAKLKTLTPSQAQQLAQIMRYGGDYDKIAKALAKMSKLNIQDIYKIFEEVAKNDYKFAGQFYKYRNKKYIPYKYNQRLQNQVKALAKITADEYINITGTLGFATTKNGKRIYTKLAKTYQNLLDKAVLSVSQGKTTFDTEMYSTIKELASSGIRTIDYENGYSLRVDSAVRNALNNGLTKMHMEMQEELGKQFDSDGVEISIHTIPAPDHMYVQGKQFSNEEFKKFQNDEDAVSYDGTKFPAESSETGRDRRSIGQYNCYHYTFAIILGASKPAYTDEELKNIIKESTKKIKFDGKEYTKYETTQLQRRIETEIRTWKDIQIAGKASDNDTLIQQAQGKITQLTNKYKDLSKASGLQTKLERARVQGYRRTTKKYVLPKIVGSENSVLQDMVENSKIGLLVPKNAKLESVKVIAGYGTSTPLKTAKKLYKDYPALPQIWQKKRATVIGKYKKYEIHYYENGNIQYYGKIKGIIKEKEGKP